MANSFPSLMTRSYVYTLYYMNAIIYFFNFLKCALKGQTPPITRINIPIMSSLKASLDVINDLFP